jgi:hypothetical protein
VSRHPITTGMSQVERHGQREGRASWQEEGAVGQSAAATGRGSGSGMPRAGAAPLNSAGADITSSFPGIRSSISKTPRSLLLTGAVVGRTASGGRAFIGIDARNPQTYVVGALLANGARLVGIYKDHVIIKKDGQSARLDIQGRGAFHWFGYDSSALTVVTAASGFAGNPVVSAELFTDYIRPSPVYDGETDPSGKSRVCGGGGL